MFIIWILIVANFQVTIAGYIEIVNVSGCENCKIYLTCRHLNSIIAILDVNFERSKQILENSSFVPSTVFPPFHPRQALNQRCSGVNHCSFILTEDCPGGDTWGAGNLTVKYACVSDDRVQTFCNSQIILPNINNYGISEGFIHNPGYPRFYATEKECRWRLQAPPQQRLHLTILDLALTADRIVRPDDCSDYLEIIDSGQVTETTCKLMEPPLEIHSQSDNIELVLVSSHSLIPQRGVLIHYIAVGCTTPQSPQDGYLVYRNDTFAEYRCCVGYIFPGDAARTRIIRCLGSYWNTPLPLPDCQRELIKPPIPDTNTLIAGMASDLLAPALLIAALFLINFIVLFYIYKIRQKQAIEFADEELGTLPGTTETTSP